MCSIPQHTTDHLVIRPLAHVENHPSVTREEEEKERDRGEEEEKEGRRLTKMLQDHPLLVEYVKSLLDPPSSLPLNLTNPHLTHFSQYGQTQYAVLHFWGAMRGGFFVEAGAVDGEYLSNSLYLEREREWWGLLVEAVPDSYSLLRHRHRHVYTLQAALATTPRAGRVLVRQDGKFGELSSVDDTITYSKVKKKSNKNNVKGNEIQVRGREHVRRNRLQEEEQGERLIAKLRGNDLMEKETSVKDVWKKKAQIETKPNLITITSKDERIWMKEQSIQDKNHVEIVPEDRKKNKIRSNENEEQQNMKRENGNGMWVPSVPLYTALKALNVTTIDFFSLDIEGNELEVLKTIPWDKVKVRLMCVECNKDKSKGLEKYLTSLGYLYIGKRIIDCWFGLPQLLHDSVLRNEMIMNS
ncbi:hypothetical protein Pmani_000199 [Petrolisthes manimaculis]|uniref:Methyltransferase FkbM domain-containing protein n=1 Tax=Petrolisthes manimaculis TaxID=1843537 RepID=A0AAE1QQK8_9EUCA|nr:hypothetical protein Pmani_000199 [Petrolisthes manimaculis]